MPFIVADDGIVYSDAPELEEDGVNYKAIKVSYQANIDDSPDHEYILYYHPETKKMGWLAYTVTYGGNKKSDQFSFIKYAQWQEITGLSLPQALHWYKTEKNASTIMKGVARIFERGDIDSASMDNGFYSMPENGQMVMSN